MLKRFLPALIPALLALSANASSGAEITINNWSAAQWDIAPGRALAGPGATIHPGPAQPGSLVLKVEEPGEHIYRLWDPKGPFRCPRTVLRRLSGMRPARPAGCWTGFTASACASGNTAGARFPPAGQRLSATMDLE